MSAMSTPEERRKTRDRLFQSLFAALPEDQKRIVKDYARRTLTENPPTMQKSEFMRHVIEKCKQFVPRLTMEFEQYFRQGTTSSSSSGGSAPPPGGAAPGRGQPG
eukprot:CAMPEP_0177724152 /NCGR_PEP_ID=MMETSP0484_2-20121128/18580_1 /TAXON_ID=354590 /ORGANISM="Rhodomonas lens, Strain RHODO" /LENGTH=104 /DNA_ID=CAMNT_0019236609 /DNA_START=60 /DNA_END=370 /DNA_ORIENTATION=-